MNIIGINGFKRSGKGETAMAVERILDTEVVKQVGFADKLKIIAAKALGFTDLADRECIELMDEAKESWTIEMTQQDPNHMDPYGPGYPVGQVVAKVSGRQYLQHLGNQARGVFGENFWIDQVLPNPGTHNTWVSARHAAEYMYTGVDVLCVTDVRYENEAQRIKALGGVVWEVLRPGTGSDGHASEQPLPRNLVDWEIHNEGNLDTLEGLVAEALHETVKS